MKAIFCDTSFYIALTNKYDLYHLKAKEWSLYIDKNQLKVHWHDGILLEIGDGFSGRGYKDLGIELVENLISDSTSVRYGITPELISKALSLQKSHQDKSWGLTDCISFVIMQENSIDAALTSDRHFAQAGFRPLLYENPPQ